MYKGHDHVYECYPFVGINRRLEEDQRCMVMLTVSPYTEQDADNIAAGQMMAKESNAKWGQLNSERLNALVKGHFKGAKNVCVGLEDCPDFDVFRAKADPEIVLWVLGAVYRSELLDAAEVKNSELE